MKRKLNYIDPFVMAGGFLLLFFLIYLLHLSIVLVSGQMMDQMNIWIYNMGAAMVFSIFASINMLFVEDTSRYYYKTILAFTVLMVTGVLISTLISGESIVTNQTYRRILLYVVFAFLAFISIVSLIKRFDQWSRNYDKNFLNKDKDENA